MAFVNAKCTNCGGDIQLDDTKKNGFCLHCGTKIKVEDAIKKVKIDSTDNIEKYLKLARNANDGGNNSETEKYCNMILEIDNNNVEVWFLKGVSVGWQSTIANNRLNEMATAFLSGLECIDSDDEETLKLYSDKMCAEMIRISKAVIDLVCNNFVKYTMASSVSDYADQISNMMSSLYPLMIVLAKNLDDGLDLNLLNNYAATMGNSAAVSAWNNVRAAFGPNKEDMTKYAWETFLEEGGYCLQLLKTALIMSKEIDNAKLIVDNYVFINNTLKDSCSYKYNYGDFGPYYTVDYTLTREAKQTREKMNIEMQNQLKEKVLEIEEDKRTFYKNNPELHKKDVAENKKIKEEKEAEIKKNDKEIEKLNTKIQELETEKSAIGFFKFSEKRVVKDKIKDEQAKLNQFQNANKALQTELDKAEDFLKKFEKLEK